MASKEAAARFARASSSSFRIDALLARQDPVHSSSSPSSESDSGHMSPRVVSPSSRHSSSSPCNLDERQQCTSPAWARPTSPHCLTSMSIAQQSDMFNAGTSSLYAAMYGSHGSMSPSCRSNIPLLPHSAFHSPLHDFKGHLPSAGLSMDWLARAGLLYHRSPGMCSPDLQRESWVTIELDRCLRLNIQLSKVLVIESVGIVQGLLQSLQSQAEVGKREG